MLGGCAIPLALLLIGATILDYWDEVGTMARGSIITGACMIRLLLLPILFLAMARWLPCSLELKRVIVIEAAMPSAVFPIVMAKHYKGDIGIALQVVLGSSIIGLLTIPLWIHWGLKWISF